MDLNGNMLTKDIISVPEMFRQPHPFDYPPGNHKIFEHWFFENYKDEENKSERIYLPIFWTSYYVRNKYGKNINAIRHLQKFINTLDKSFKYFTIIQYDDGIKNSVKGLDIKVFAMSGPRIDYPLPLICEPHKYEFPFARDLFANFVGGLTHQIRKGMIPHIKRHKDYYVSAHKHNIKDYCSVLSRSVFTLCPRGYGQTSFRIMEALQYGSIPVYISNDFIIPHNVPFEEYGVLIGYREISRIDRILRGISWDEIHQKQQRGREIYEQYYTYEANKTLILNNL